MKKILSMFILVLPLSLFASLNVAVAYPYIGAITEEIGGDHVTVKVLAPGSWDPHFVVPRPSLIAKLRNADVLIMNGGELEIGWLPALVARANNARIAGNGTLDLSRFIKRIDIPVNVSRAQGDVHAGGNPHFHLDPHNILPIAEAITAFLTHNDPAHAEAYRDNLQRFTATWRKNLSRWDAQMQQASGKKIIQYHAIFNYFLRAYGIESIGTIEPLPGIPPSTRHTMELIEAIKAHNACCILHDVYHSTKTAHYIANRTGVNVVILPHDIGALDSITSLEAFYDYLVEAVTP